MYSSVSGETTESVSFNKHRKVQKCIRDERRIIFTQSYKFFFHKKRKRKLK